MEPQHTLWITDRDGQRGRLLHFPSQDAASISRVRIQLANGQQVEVPIDMIARQQDENYSLSGSFRELEQAVSNPTETAMEAQNPLIVPVIEEALSVGKHTVETGRVRIIKRVQEHTEVVDEPLLREEVAIERVTINRAWDGPPPGVRHEGETLIVPVLEEVLVVEKRLMLKEEWHVRRVQREVHAPQDVILKKEEVRVERVAPASAPIDNSLSEV
jgi:uncharacterized protein (TIGR02271 family)